MECVSWLQKPWGYTACLLANSAFELWTGHVLAGGYSSRHWHDKKWNRIASRTAVLRCTIYHGDGDTEQAIWIAPGEFYDFAPGVEHRFEVMQSGGSANRATLFAATPTDGCHRGMSCGLSADAIGIATDHHRGNTVHTTKPPPLVVSVSLRSIRETCDKNACSASVFRLTSTH
jgi:hypothetical protein